jgi:large subunit ribosomal protein L31
MASQIQVQKDTTMKPDTHPDYHEITVIMTDGTQFVTRSTYGKAGDKLQLDIDSKSHPAWTGTHRLVDRGGQLAKFNKRFAGLSKKDDAEEATAAPASKEPKIKLTTTAASAKKKS